MIPQEDSEMENDAEMSESKPMGMNSELLKMNAENVRPRTGRRDDPLELGLDCMASFMPFACLG